MGSGVPPTKQEEKRKWALRITAEDALQSPVGRKGAREQRSETRKGKRDRREMEQRGQFRERESVQWIQT